MPNVYILWLVRCGEKQHLVTDMSTQRTRSWSATSHHSQRSNILTRSPSLEAFPTSRISANNSDFQKKLESISKEGNHDSYKLSWKNHWICHKWLMGEPNNSDNTAVSFSEGENLKGSTFSNEAVRPQLSTVILPHNIQPLDFKSRASEVGQGHDSSPDSLQECIIPHPYHNGTNEDSDQFDSIDTLATPDQCDMPSQMWNHWLRTERSNSTDSAVVLSVSNRQYCLERQMSAAPHCESIADSSSVHHNSVQRKKSFATVQSMSCPSLVMPSVVVSDHSNCDDEMIHNNIDMPCPDLLSVTIDDIPRNTAKFRRFSTCSTGSNASTLSTLSLEDDTSQSDISDSSATNPIYVRRPSAWRKVRNIVHWSPFIQTYKKQKYPWIQLAGHQGNFKSGTHGTILKKQCGKEEQCLQRLMHDPLRPFVPEFRGKVELGDGESYLELQDLLAGYTNPCVMDIKVGLRTYLEDELAKAREKPKLRKDMYEKMIHVDPNEPTEEENRQKAVTKPRYMIWRETISSTATLGFRIEGIKNKDGTSRKDFKMTKSKEQVLKELRSFVDDYPNAAKNYLQRLQCLYSTLMVSEFFSSHEMIGSSLLFVHDSTHASIWMIDFGKAMLLPDGVKITHKNVWEAGNHEDGYLIGIDNLIKLFEQLISENSVAHTSTMPS